MARTSKHSNSVGSINYSAPFAPQLTLHPATEADAHLDEWDYTRLSAFAMCPTWMIVRYGLSKTMSNSDREMALEAGTACHDVFAAVRLLDAFEHNVITEGQFAFHGARLFGAERFGRALAAYEAALAEDERTQHLNFGLDILDSTGFYDSPFDRRRTMANIEEACIWYIDRWPWGKNPVWVRGSGDNDDIGVEIGFNYVVEHNIPGAPAFRFVGRLDGLHVRSGSLVLGENKTASRLDEAWCMSFEMSHQVTGYCIAASEFTGQAVTRADVVGLALPLPKSGGDFGGLTTEKVKRNAEAFERWARWVAHVIEQYYRYRDDPISAPKFTHSCSRYFRPCSMIPFCAAPDDEKQQILDEMTVKTWSPLDSSKAQD